MRDPLEDNLYIDSAGCLTEIVWMGDHELHIHYGDEMPDSDITTVDGIRCTTALRTAIDLAPDVTADHLDEIVQSCLDRGLFTVEEAWARLAQPDMTDRWGARILGGRLPPAS